MSTLVNIFNLPTILPFEAFKNFWREIKDRLYFWRRLVIFGFSKIRDLEGKEFWKRYSTLVRRGRFWKFDDFLLKKLKTIEDQSFKKFWRFSPDKSLTFFLQNKTYLGCGGFGAEE